MGEWEIMQLIHLIAPFPSIYPCSQPSIAALPVWLSADENDSFVTKVSQSGVKIGKWGWWFNGGNVKRDFTSSTSSRDDVKIQFLC